MVDNIPDIDVISAILYSCCHKVIECRKYTLHGVRSLTSTETWPPKFSWSHGETPCEHVDVSPKSPVFQAFRRGSKEVQYIYRETKI